MKNYSLRTEDLDIVNKADLPDTSSFVTTNTAQNISGIKTIYNSTDAPYFVLKNYYNGLWTIKGGNATTPSGGYTITLPNKTGTIALTSDLPSTTNFVTIADTQTISGVKTFTAESSFTGETKFTNATYAATWSDIADGIGKSSLFTRAACMQMITGQILAPNKAYTDSNGGYSTEVNTIKFQKMTASNGQPVVTDLAVISESGMTLGTKTVATTSDLPTFSYSNNVLTITY